MFTLPVTSEDLSNFGETIPFFPGLENKLRVTENFLEGYVFVFVEYL